jgi:hypothetical protein
VTTDSSLVLVTAILTGCVSIDREAGSSLVFVLEVVIAGSL